MVVYFKFIVDVVFIGKISLKLEFERVIFLFCGGGMGMNG